jgi:hypothetical protein
MSGKPSEYKAYLFTDEEVELIMDECYCDLKDSKFCESCGNGGVDD